MLLPLSNLTRRGRSREKLLYFLDLEELEFDRCFAAEDRDERSQLLFLGLYFVDDAGEIEEGARRNFDTIAFAGGGPTDRKFHIITLCKPAYI